MLCGWTTVQPNPLSPALPSTLQNLTASFGNTCTHWREQCCVLVCSRRDTQEVGYSEHDPQKFAKKGSWAEKGKNLTKFKEDLVGEVWLKPLMRTAAGYVYAMLCKLVCTGNVSHRYCYPPLSALC